MKVNLITIDFLRDSLLANVIMQHASQYFAIPVLQFAKLARDLVIPGGGGNKSRQTTSETTNENAEPQEGGMASGGNGPIQLDDEEFEEGLSWEDRVTKEWVWSDERNWPIQIDTEQSWDSLKNIA